MTQSEIDKSYADLRERLCQHFMDDGRLAVIKAPPGSGKTHTLIELLVELVAEGKQVAVTAQTNSQADDICRRIAGAHPGVPVARFSSKGLTPGRDIPAAVQWITDKHELPTALGVTVATTAKWALTEIETSYDLLAVDEAWQMSWADFMQLSFVSGRFLLIGDPGQIPPVVTIDVRRWETSPRAPHLPAPNVVLAQDDLLEGALIDELPACRRLPAESVDYVRMFYDFPFEAYVEPGTRSLELPESHPWHEPLSVGRPLALTIPTPENGPPVEVDHGIVDAVVRAVGELFDQGAMIGAAGMTRPLGARDIGVTSSHRAMNAALEVGLREWSPEIRVDTPERWQGLEKPVMIAVHPLSGVSTPSEFDLETGRLCVMASRHEVGLILVTRDHVGEMLTNYVPIAAHAPGRPDVVGRGHDSHLRFWRQIEAAGALIPLS